MNLDALLPFWNGGHAKTLDFRQVKTEVVIEERSQHSSVGELHGLPLTVSPIVTSRLNTLTLPSEVRALIMIQLTNGEAGWLAVK